MVFPGYQHELVSASQSNLQSVNIDINCYKNLTKINLEHFRVFLIVHPPVSKTLDRIEFNNKNTGY